MKKKELVNLLREVYIALHDAENGCTVICEDTGDEYKLTASETDLIAVTCMTLVAAAKSRNKDVAADSFIGTAATLYACRKKGGANHGN